MPWYYIVIAEGNTHRRCYGGFSTEERANNARDSFLADNPENTDQGTVIEEADPYYRLVVREEDFG